MIEGVGLLLWTVCGLWKPVVVKKKYVVVAEKILDVDSWMKKIITVQSR